MAALWEVQTYTLGDGWVNCWKESDDATPQTFETEAAARAELQEHLGNVKAAVDAGHMEDYDPEDYRVVRVGA